MVILVDTSVWIEHLRRTGSPAHLEFRELATSDPASIATTEPIAMELLAGPTDPFTVRRIEDQLGTLDDLTVDPTQDFRAAAGLARARATAAMRQSVSERTVWPLWRGTTVWHCDHYVRIAKVSDLQQRTVG